MGTFSEMLLGLASLLPRCVVVVVVVMGCGEGTGHFCFCKNLPGKDSENH